MTLVPGAALGLSLAWPVGGHAQDRMGSLDPYLMNRDAEVALARSAAPPVISGTATVLVLTRQGYETAVRGTNGFVCKVDRQWQTGFGDPDFWDPTVRAPVCFNPQAARSVLPIMDRRTQLTLAGRSRIEILNELKAAEAKGEFPKPEAGAMAYMMSKDQHLAPPDTMFQPHLMFFMSSAGKGADWGANLPHTPVLSSPETLPDGSREPLLVFVIPVGQWSDGTPAPAVSR